MTLNTYLKINPADSVVVCLTDKKKGDIIEVDGQLVVLVHLQLVVVFLLLQVVLIQ